MSDLEARTVKFMKAQRIRFRVPENRRGNWSMNDVEIKDLHYFGRGEPGTYELRLRVVADIELVPLEEGDWVPDQTPDEDDGEEEET